VSPFHWRDAVLPAGSTGRHELEEAPLLLFLGKGWTGPIMTLKSITMPGGQWCASGCLKGTAESAALHGLLSRACAIASAMPKTCTGRGQLGRRSASSGR
jgi:hypothetical protein